MDTIAAISRQQGSCPRDLGLARRNEINRALPSGVEQVLAGPSRKAAALVQIRYWSDSMRRRWRAAQTETASSEFARRRLFTDDSRSLLRRWDDAYTRCWFNDLLALEMDCRRRQQPDATGAAPRQQYQVQVRFWQVCNSNVAFSRCSALTDVTMVMKTARVAVNAGANVSSISPQRSYLGQEVLARWW